VLAVATRSAHPDAARLGAILNRGVRFCGAVGLMSVKTEGIQGAENCAITIGAGLVVLDVLLGRRAGAPHSGRGAA